MMLTCKASSLLFMLYSPCHDVNLSSTISIVYALFSPSLLFMLYSLCHDVNLSITISIVYALLQLSHCYNILMLSLLMMCPKNDDCLYLMGVTSSVEELSYIYYSFLQFIMLLLFIYITTYLQLAHNSSGICCLSMIHFHTCTSLLTQYDS